MTDRTKTIYPPIFNLGGIKSINVGVLYTKESAVQKKYT